MSVHDHQLNNIAGGALPSHTHGMASSFEFSTHATIVFSFFQTHTLFQFLFAMFLLFWSGVLREHLSSYRRKVLLTADRSDVNHFRTTVALLLVVVYAYDMVLMLAIMTYNIGIFVAIVSGVGVGYYWNFDVAARAGYEKVMEQEDEKVSSCC